MSVQQYETTSAVLDAYTVNVQLGAKACTEVHVVEYAKELAVPKVHIFETAQPLEAWCRDNDQPEAISGSFFWRETEKPLGDIWIGGVRQDTEPFDQEWARRRGAIAISPEGDIAIGYRHDLNERPCGDLLQAGPILLLDGEPVLFDTRKRHYEGFSAGQGQFDSDITLGRYPRGAIAFNDTTVFSVVADGRSQRNAGMDMTEFMTFMQDLGATSALNLDGGGSATQITNGKMVNNPMDSDNTPCIGGRPLYSAITF